MTDEITATGQTNLDDDPTWVHPLRERGRDTGRMIAGNEEALCTAMCAALDYFYDETVPEYERERALQSLWGLAEGYRDLMVIQPLQFLTRQQTARVMALPRNIRRAWESEYRRGCRQWVRAGGALSGKRPILPSIPGDPASNQ